MKNTLWITKVSILAIVATIALIIIVMSRVGIDKNIAVKIYDVTSNEYYFLAKEEYGYKVGENIVIVVDDTQNIKALITDIKEEELVISDEKIVRFDIKIPNSDRIKEGESFKIRREYDSLIDFMLRSASNRIMK